MLQPTLSPNSIPLACNMAAFTPEQRARHDELAGLLFSASGERHALPEGYSVALPADHWLLAAEFAALERLCCPFITFALHLESGADHLTLRLTGGEGVKAVIQAEFSPLFDDVT